MILLLLACRSEPLEVGIEQAAPNRDLHPIAPATAELGWSVDGTPTDFDGVVPARHLQAGQRWVLTATTTEETATAEHTVSAPSAGNVLVLLLDDVGTDKIGAYDGAYAPATPRIDALAEQGVQFDRAYASPVCSPTRGVLLTGRHARRTGLGWIVDTGPRTATLPSSAVTVPEALPPGWSNSAVGKWHLAGPRAGHWLDHPNESGFTWFAGAPGNPYYADGLGYFEWDRNVNGSIEVSTTYMTVDTVDTALERMETLPEPWFLYVAFNAVHGPLNVPPEELRPEGSAPLTGEDPRHVRYDAILEVLDAEIGRLMDSADPDVLARTTVMTIGDNGTGPNGLPPDAIQGRGKHTPYEGGIRVPFIVTGPLVTQPGSHSDALIHVTDVLPTVMEIAGVPLEGEDGEWLVADDQEVLLDGRSLVRFLEDPTTEGRPTVYAEGFYPNGPGPYAGDRRALQNATHKLVRWNEREEFYRLEGPHLLDSTDLLTLGTPLSSEDELKYDLLRAELDILEASLRPTSFSP